MLDKLFIIEHPENGSWYVAYADPINGNRLEIDEETAKQMIEAKSH